MISQIKQKLDLGWRIPTYRQYLFYYKTCRNYKQIIRYERGTGELSCLSLRNGLTIKFSDPHQTLEIFREIWRYHIYTRFYMGKSPGTVIDIGANLGIFSLFARQTWPNSKIIAFEPEPGNFQLLQENIQLNQVTGVETRRQAVDTCEGKREFLIKEKSGWHSLYQSHEKEISKTEVETISLTQVMTSCSGTVDFLKIDCEGCEWDVFQDQPRETINAIRYISLEYHEIQNHHYTDLEKYFHGMGFDIKHQPSTSWTGMIYAQKNENLPR